MPIDDPLKYVEARIPLANAYFSFGTLDCKIDNSIMNIESPIPGTTLTAMRIVILLLKPAKAMLAVNIDIIEMSTFFFPYVSESLPTRGAITAAVIKYPDNIHEELE